MTSRPRLGHGDWAPQAKDRAAELGDVDGRGDRRLTGRVQVRAMRAASWVRDRSPSLA